MAQQTVRAAAQSLRGVHSSAVRAAAAVDVPISVELSPMFDIFDVPVRLRRTRSGAEEHTAPAARPYSPGGRALNPMTPTSLPNPLVFEGPAGRRPVVRRRNETIVAAYAPQHGSEPVVTVFDGPARSGGRRQRPLGSVQAQSGGESKPPPDSRTIRLAVGAAVTATMVTLSVAHP
ncbi:hypothetical protein MSAN_00965800 [Mycena sanguinolenta]|uniref:Uncharacterized protein n=1 Tax=Mycena sanguinolenta TaxID=230812 RepID=A0A8H6YXK6_9AGAR|nr:hypothetical protein MSAN_00965800 [Mycena sanguinolenta]